MRQVVFMASDGLVKAFTVCEATEVEAASPSIFIYISGEVVVAAPIIQCTLEDILEKRTVLSR
jgi:hypothetical protein